MVKIGSDSRGFCESDRLIYICYVGGACGYALRRLLLCSPDTDGLDLYEQDVRHDGAAHLMVSRSGLKREPNDYVTQLNLNMIPPEVGLIESAAWWDDDVDSSLISYARSLINNSVTFDDQPASRWQSWKRWIWVDHVPPRAARLLFPNAQIMLVYRDWKSTFRDFAIKNIFQSTMHNRILHGDTNDETCSIDARLLDRGETLTRQNFSDELRGSCHWAMWCHDRLNEDFYRQDACVVDIDRLLGKESWESEYDLMIKNLGLIPNGVEVKRFIDDYNRAQPIRGEWTPNPNWTWVKVGPNRPGRW